MATNSGMFTALYAPGLRKLFFDKFNSLPTEYDKIANLVSSSRQYEEDRRVAGLGAMPEKTQGSSITYDDFIQGSTTVRYTHKTFAAGYRITMEAQQDELYGVFKKINEALAKGAHTTREVIFWNVFNNAFAAFTSSGTAGTGLDGLTLCSTAHTLVGGGTYANRPTVDTDLGIASLQAGITAFERGVDERGLRELHVPRFVVIPPEQKWLAREILNSSYKPFTADNEINAIVQDDLQYMVSHYLTDTDAWFLTAAPGDHDLNYFQRMPLGFKEGDDFDTGDAKFRAWMRCSAGFSDWRGVYGSPGS